MTLAHIYPLSKETSQSGHSKSGRWLIQLERPSAQSPESLMGWTQSGDTANQVNMTFSSAEKAEAFAKSQGWRYTITGQNDRIVTPRNYSDNFVYTE